MKWCGHICHVCGSVSCLQTFLFLFFFLTQFYISTIPTTSYWSFDWTRKILIFCWDFSWACLRVLNLQCLKLIKKNNFYKFLKHIIPNEILPSLTPSLRRDWAPESCRAQAHMGRAEVARWARRTWTQRARKRQKKWRTRNPCWRSWWVIGVRTELHSLLLSVCLSVWNTLLLKPRRSFESAQGFPRPARASLRWD